MTTSPFHTRPVQPEERSQFKDLLDAYLRELDAYDEPRDASSEALETRAERHLNTLSADPSRYFWWSLVGDAPAGFVVFRIQPRRDRPEQLEGIIDEFYVLPAERRRGRGRSLAQAALSLMRERGVARIRLNVLVRNEAAQGFWRSLEFDPTFSLFGKAYLMERPG